MERAAALCVGLPVAAKTWLHEGVPVVLLSGDTHLAEQAAAMGVAGWIGKPIVFEKLLSVVERYAPKRDAGGKLRV